MCEVVIIHPDLGIGGAERLIVDVALALQLRGHRVTMLTAHHDPGHCFDETRDGTLTVRCLGDWIPRSIFGKCHAVLAYLRMIYLALYLTLFSAISYQVVICDLVSACVPALKLLQPSSKKVIFYCHHPDQLLTERKSSLKRLYRYPLDWLEEWSTGFADTVLVNSLFTGEVFRETFKRLGHIKPDVLYPSHHVAEDSGDAMDEADTSFLGYDQQKVEHMFLSINRYERKKNVALCIEALAELRSQLSNDSWNKVHLVIAGGYDLRVSENVEYHDELVQLARYLKVDEHVTFLRSCSDAQKRALLRRCTCLIYTPHGEHFGIVPIEAMHGGRPVIAVNSGGPKETVVHGRTGFLCEQDDGSFAKAMLAFVREPGLAREMGEAGKDRVAKHFSFESFVDRMNEVVDRLVKRD